MAELDWQIRDFKPRDAPAFAALNRAWIEEMFGMEDKDRRQLEHPVKTIIEPGGHIVVADAHGWVVGTGAIVPATFAPQDGNSWLEIVKMATEPSARGRGIGAAVLDRLIEVARERGADRIWLETNTQLEAATALYEKVGFVALEDDAAWETPYLRCNLQMTMAL